MVSKIKLCISVALLSVSLSIFAHAQGGSVSGQVISPAPPTGTGGPAPFASVLVCPYIGSTGTPCSPTANLFLDPGLTVSSPNPATTDGFGNYSLWATPAAYVVQITPVNGTVFSYLVQAVAGTVTSVGLSMPSSIFVVNNSPITSFGTLSVTLASQLPGLVFGSPLGSPGLPTFRNSSPIDFGPQSPNTVLGNCTSASANPTFCALTAAMIPEAFVNTGVFTNTQQNNYLSSALGGINTATWYSSAQGGQFSTDALAGGIACPFGATVHQCNGIAGYAVSAANSVGGGGGLGDFANTVGGYFTSQSVASNTANWGFNTLVQDFGGTSNTWMVGTEIDTNFNGSPAYATGIQGNGAGTGTLPTAIAPGQTTFLGAAFMDVATPYTGLGGSNWRWPLGINFRRGAINGTAVQIDAPCLSGAVPCNSDAITFTAYDASNVAHTASIGGDSTGSLLVSQLRTSGAAPTCTFTSGGGTGPTCTLDTGSSNSAGIIIITAGTGSPAGAGTITLTFNSPPFGVHNPVCEYQANDGANSWSSLPVMKDKTPSTTSDLFTWTNGTGPTPLGVSTAFWINYQCWAK